jgi:hypothetical protein
MLESVQKGTDGLIVVGVSPIENPKDMPRYSTLHGKAEPFSDILVAFLLLACGMKEEPFHGKSFTIFRVLLEQPLAILDTLFVVFSFMKILKVRQNVQ